MKRVAACSIVLGILVSLGCARPAPAATARGSDKPFELQAAYRPLSEVAARITQQGTIAVTVDPEVAEWNATVGFRGDPVTLLHLLSTNFGLTLIRTDGSDKRFRLLLFYILFACSEQHGIIDEGIPGVSNCGIGKELHRSSRGCEGFRRSDFRRRSTFKGRVGPTTFTEGASARVHSLRSGRLGTNTARQRRRHERSEVNFQHWPALARE